MEPVTASAVATLISYWGGKAFDKVFDTTFEEFSKDSIHWLKSLFVKEDGKPKEVMEKFSEKPDSPARQNAVKAVIETELEDNPRAKAWLIQIAEAIEKKGNTTSITNSRNVVAAPMNIGGNVIIGDNNTSSK